MTKIKAIEWMAALYGFRLVPKRDGGATGIEAHQVLTHVQIGLGLGGQTDASILLSAADTKAFGEGLIEMAAKASACDVDG